MDPIKVYVAIPSRTKGYWDMYMHLLQACNYSAQRGIFCSIEPHVGSSLICRARQELQWRFLYKNTDCDYFLQIDDDVSLPMDAIVKMVESGKDVIGGMYSLKSKSGRLAIRMLGNKKYTIKDFGSEPLEIKYLATGCFMQTRAVAQRAYDFYKKDRFYLANDPDKKLKKQERERVALYTPYIYKDEYLSEDYAYCQRLLDIGESIWLHPQVRCGHWGLAQYGVE